MAKPKTQRDRLNELYKDNLLTKDDVFDSGHYKIITRSGIEKIQYKNNIVVTYEPIRITFDLVVVKATGIMGTETTLKTIETFGEWNKTHAKTKKNGDLVPFYSVALAEKRALSRVVLKLMGLYEYGFKGEDEEFYNLSGDDLAESTQIEYIEDLLRTSTYDHEWRATVEAGLHGMTKTQASELIKDLKNNQQDDPVKNEVYRKIDYLEDK